MIIGPTPGTLAWHHYNVRDFRRNLLRIRFDSHEFEAAVVALKIACQDLQRATKKATKDLSAFLKEVTKYNPKKKRLPRKQKKAYIKKFGRQAYNKHIKFSLSYANRNLQKRGSRK